MGEHKEIEGASLRSEELPAGRELDALVAERVMGLSVRRDWPVSWAGGEVFCYDPELRREDYEVNLTSGDPEADYPERDHITAEQAPHCVIRDVVESYSTDIAAAWKVVEKMGDRLDLIYPAWDINDSGVRLMHWVVVTQHGYGIIDGRRGHVADTAPLAICRAALRAVGTSGEVPADSAISPPPPGSPRTET